MGQIVKPSLRWRVRNMLWPIFFATQARKTHKRIFSKPLRRILNSRATAYAAEIQTGEMHMKQEKSEKEERFLRKSDVRRRVGYSVSSIYRMIAAGEFPRPYNLGARAVAWKESEVEAWIKARTRTEKVA